MTDFDVRWFTNTEQANNKRNNFLIEYQGKIKTLPQWAEVIKTIPYDTLWARLKVMKWPVEKAFTTPKKY